MTPPAVSPRTTVLILAAVLALPLAGALLAGRRLAEFTPFPPLLEIPTDHVRFSKPAVGAVAALLVAVALSWLVGRRKLAVTRNDAVAPPSAYPRKFPVWGWAALAWTFAWWTLAWTRWGGFEPFQQYTFFPLWLGFIVSANAAIERRTGSCLMRRAPRRWLALFAASAACWWAFEWLNRFVRNWHYLNVERVGALEYFLHATACFSTVLPAVAAVAEWLSSHERWNHAVRNGPAWTWLARRDTAVALALFGCVSLFATGGRPQWFYPALWVSPLALLLAAPVLRSRPGLVHEMARGDWLRAATWMIAALVCGFFWELWNWHSLAKWIYTVPGVDRWHLFEMPGLGYAGYLPFGVECLLVAEWAVGDRWRSRASS
ncbi:MAG TPA: hypothetical protein VHO24_10945 [Opitutaceae bacterium]|nr:hypothetical protein [Opitutaceae bacterium]